MEVMERKQNAIVLVPVYHGGGHLYGMKRYLLHRWSASFPMKRSHS